MKFLVLLMFLGSWFSTYASKAGALGQGNHMHKILEMEETSHLELQSRVRRSPSNNKKSRNKKTKVECPDTCQLKRRIGKLEASLKKRISSIEDMCPDNATSFSSSVETVRSSEILSQVQIEGYLDEVRRNLSGLVHEELDENVGELKGILMEGQEDIATTRREVNQLIRSIPETLAHLSSTSVSSQRLPPSSELQEVVNVMNLTIRRLRQQNNLLRRRAKESEDLADVIRDQNIILSTQNRQLRLHSQGLDRRTQFTRKRVEDLEFAVSFLNESRRQERVGSQPRIQEDLRSLERRVTNNELSSRQREERMNSLDNLLRQAIQGGGIVLPTTTALPQPDNPPNDCQELYQMGFRQSGVYRVHPWQAQDSFDVFCEQQYYGGGWTMIQRRRDGSVDFERDWDDYSLGFGDLDGEHWLGNEKVYRITNQNTYRLHIVLMDWEGRRVYAEYEGFKLSSSRDYYSIRFGRYDGTAGDALRGTAEDGSRNLYLSRFGTRDLDNDSCRPCMYEGEAFENCAELNRSGWWYRACADSNLNGRYVKQGNLTNCDGGNCFGIQWRTWHDEANYSLKASLMLIKAAGAEE